MKGYILKHSMHQHNETTIPQHTLVFDQVFLGGIIHNKLTTHTGLPCSKHTTNGIQS